MHKNRIHPGEFLREELAERGISQTELAHHIGVARGVINLICNGHRGISPEMAKKLAVALGSHSAVLDESPIQLRFQRRGRA